VLVRSRRAQLAGDHEVRKALLRVALAKSCDDLDHSLVDVLPGEMLSYLGDGEHGDSSFQLAAQ